MSLRWSRVSVLASKARSSHCATVTRSGHLLLYSGELRPRIPVDSALHLLDLEAPSPTWRALSPAPALSHAAPEPRVGASAAYDPQTNSLYVWGGRGGVDMAPLDRFQAGIWRAPLDGLDTAVPWERLPSTNDDSDAAPALRSFHASVIAGGKLYIHAGCPASGRLADLHAYDLATYTWHKLADAPAEPRGGTAIAAISLPSSSEHVLVRFGGFAGIELPRIDEGALPPLDMYTPSTDAWSTVYPAPDPDHGFPGPRSVHGLVPFTAGTADAASRVPVALVYHGERDASTIGHAGAGSFWDDAWLLLLLASSSPPTFQWKKLRVSGDGDAATGPLPEPRGWFPSACYVSPSKGKTRIVLSGGLLSSNERSGEVWVGDVEL